MPKFWRKKFLLVVAALALLASGFVGGWLAKKKLATKQKDSPTDPHLAFLDEVYQVISQNYWEKNL